MEILAFPGAFAKATQLAEQLKCPVRKTDLHLFPDEESLVQLPPDPAAEVIVYQSLDHPNPRLIELLLLARTARDLGVRHLTLVAPYLCYMRQDKAFQPGQAVSQQIIGRFLADLFDAVITVDPHLHRVRSMAQAVPAKQALALSASRLIGEFIRQRHPDVLLVGPDSESAQWVSEVAQSGGMDFVVAHKIRHGDTAVEISLPAFDYSGRDAVIVDDIASSGHTLATAATQLFEQGIRSVSVVVTHALFMGDALERIRRVGVESIWSTDSVEHETNVISLAPLLAEGIHQLKE